MIITESLTNIKMCFSDNGHSGINRFFLKATEHAQTKVSHLVYKQGIGCEIKTLKLMFSTFYQSSCTRSCWKQKPDVGVKGV